MKVAVVSSVNFPNTRAFRTGSQVLARNTAFNLVGQVVVAITAVACVPFVVRFLGRDAYGILSLALVAFGSFSLLELGLGRTTTKFVAEYLSKDESDRLGTIIWTSFMTQVVLGLLGGGVLAVAAPYLASKTLNVPAELIGETRTTFYLLAMATPIVLASSALRGALEGAQRFDLVNLVKVALNLLTYLLSLVAGWMRVPISGIVLLLVATRLAATVTYLVFCLHTLPMLRRVRSANLNPAFLRRLFSYAGWVAVSNFIAPLLSQVDRYLIAAIVTVEAVTFYAVPYETLNALWIVPGSIAAALFPAFSGLRTRNEQDFNSLYARPIKYILVLLGPAVLVMMVFANDILRFWQGPLFAEKSSLVLQILVLGVLINSVEWVPANLLMGFDRPDLTAICHLIQLPLYLGTAYLLIARWGIVGAAAAFALRVTFEAVFVFIASWRQAPGVWRSLGERKLLDSLVLITLLAVVLIGARALRTEGLMQIGLAILGLLAFAGATWIFVLDRFDRRLILSLLPITRREAA